MSDTYTSREIAAALGCNISTAHRRATAESWPVAGTRQARGGGKTFALASLPADIRAKLAESRLTDNAPAPAPEPAPVPAIPAPQLNLGGPGGGRRAAELAQRIMLEEKA